MPVTPRPSTSGAKSESKSPCASGSALRFQMYRNQGAGRLPSWTIAEVKKTNYGGHMYVITGATGNTGSVIAETLLAQGEKVRIISRSPERLGRFVEKGAEPFVADVTDTAALSRAFQGALAVYTMVPPVYNAADPLGEILRVGSSRSDRESDRQADPQVCAVFLCSSWAGHAIDGHVGQRSEGPQRNVCSHQ